ncbi:MAG: glycosyltransferase family 1 protein [Patescibacteria group bacterium]
MSKILIDGRFVGVGESMTRYTLEILRGVLELDKENEYTLLVRPQGLGAINEFFGESEIKRHESGSDPFRAEIKDSSFMIQVLDIPHYSLPEQTKLLQYLNKSKYDLVHFIQFNHPVRYKAPYVVTVHDLTMVGYLHRSNPLKRLAFGRVMKSAVRDSRRIITVSNTSRDEIVEYYRIDKDKIDTVYNGINHERYNALIEDKELKTKQFRKKYEIDGDYLLYTGMWKKHKNLLRLLKAFEQVKSKIQNPKSKNIEGLQLVLVGKKDESEPEVLAEIKRINNLKSKIKDRKSIVTTGYIKEEELPVAYAGALAYAIPSLSEGFGLPPLEAMACGAPVISSNVSCMPEVLGDAPLYFDPYDVDDIAGAIEQTVESRELRNDLIKKGLVQAKKYSWDKAARETWEVYKKLLG